MPRLIKKKGTKSIMEVSTYRHKKEKQINLNVSRKWETKGGKNNDMKIGQTSEDHQSQTYFFEKSNKIDLPQKKTKLFARQKEKRGKITSCQYQELKRDLHCRSCIY
jgi:hypothetical protein